MASQWWRDKVVGSTPGVLWPFYAEFACSPCICICFLQGNCSTHFLLKIQSPGVAKRFVRLGSVQEKISSANGHETKTLPEP